MSTGSKVVPRDKNTNGHREVFKDQKDETWINAEIPDVQSFTFNCSTWLTLLNLTPKSKKYNRIKHWINAEIPEIQSFIFNIPTWLILSNLTPLLLIKI